jgi:hypothetical protein
MYLIDEQNVTRLQVGQHRSQIPGPLEHRPGSRLQADPHFGGDDIGQRGLAKAWWAKHQRVVEALFPQSGRANKDFQLLTDSGLANVVPKALGPNGVIDANFPVLRFSGDQSVMF